jgi:hypothetical protein
MLLILIDTQPSTPWTLDGSRDAQRELTGSPSASRSEREFFLDNLLVRIDCIVVMIRWTGLAPWEFKSSFPGSLASTFLAPSALRPSWRLDFGGWGEW